MLLQISNTDSLTNISASGGQAQILLLTFIVLTGIILTWLITKQSKTKRVKKIIQKTKIYNSAEKEIENNQRTIGITTKNSEYKNENVNPSEKELTKINKKESTVLKETTEIQEAKYIGYMPTKNFEQKEPFTYPYVIMPEPDCIIKYSQKGRMRLKGFTETRFKSYLESLLSD